MTTELEYAFEELMLPQFGSGMMLYGHARLVGGLDGFYVADIWLDGNLLQRPPHDGGGTFEHRLFREIAKVIEADSHADVAWYAHVR